MHAVTRVPTGRLQFQFSLSDGQGAARSIIAGKLRVSCSGKHPTFSRWPLPLGLDCRACHGTACCELHPGQALEAGRYGSARVLDVGRTSRVPVAHPSPAWLFVFAPLHVRLSADETTTNTIYKATLRPEGLPEVDIHENLKSRRFSRSQPQRCRVIEAMQLTCVPFACDASSCLRAGYSWHGECRDGRGTWYRAGAGSAGA